MAVANSDPTPAPRRRQSLSAAEWRVVVAAAAAPVLVALVVLLPFALLGSASGGDVAVAAVVYGGLLGLAAGFVAVDRLQARHCPRCATRNLRGATACEDCGYDMRRRPRYACEDATRSTSSRACATAADALSNSRWREVSGGRSGGCFAPEAGCSASSSSCGSC